MADKYHTELRKKWAERQSLQDRVDKVLANKTAKSKPGSKHISLQVANSNNS